MLLTAYVSIRQHTSAYVSIRQHTSVIPFRSWQQPVSRLFLLFCVLVFQARRCLFAPDCEAACFRSRSAAHLLVLPFPFFVRLPSAWCEQSLRMLLTAYVSIREHTSVIPRGAETADAALTSYVSIREHT